MNKKEIIEAYKFLRTHNNTIPSEVIELMREAALEKLGENHSLVFDGTDTKGVCYECLNLHHKGCRDEACKCKERGHNAWWFKPNDGSMESEIERMAEEDFIPYTPEALARLGQSLKKMKEINDQLIKDLTEYLSGKLSAKSQ